MIASDVVERAADGRGTGSVVSQLGRFEAVRFLRNPLSWIGTLAGFWMMWSAFETTAPVWRRDTVYLAGAMLPLGAVAFLWFNHLQVRERHLADVLDAMPTSRAGRYRGRQYGIAAPIFLAIVASSIGLGYLAMAGPIGSIPWWEVIAGPLMVAALGLLGLALGRLLPHPIIAPIALAALAFLQLVASPNAVLTSSQPALAVEWLAPWVPPPTFEPVVIWDRRFALGHGLFLIGAIVGFTSFPLLIRTRARLLVPLGVVAAVVEIFAYSSAMVPTRDVTWVEPLLREQRCEEKLGVNYCAVEEFVEWIPRWQETVGEVALTIPVEIDWVVQRSPFFYSEEAWSERLDGVVAYNQFEWDRAGSTPNHALALALSAAESAVGLPTRPQVRPYTEQEIASILSYNPGRPELEGELRSDQAPKLCSSTGQARAVVALWAAAASIEQGPEALERALAAYSGIHFSPVASSHLPGTLIALDDVELALQLLVLPTNEVARTARARWDEVLDPSTPSSDFATWFGIDAQPTPVDSFPTPVCT